MPSDVMFVRTRHEYGSYVDFWRLVELAGYTTIYVDEIPAHDRPDRTFVISPINGEWVNGLVTEARLILWQLEWNVDGNHVAPPGVDEVWSSDYDHAKSIGAKYVLMGSDWRLNLAPDAPAVEKVYDVAMLAYMTYRRQLVYNELRAHGLVLAPNGWGGDRHEILRRTKVVLHVHQHDHVATVAPLRWCIAAAYGLPVLSERVPWVEQRPEDAPVGVYCPYRRVDTFVNEYLQFPLWMDAGMYLHEQLCVDHTFRQSVEAAL